MGAGRVNTTPVPDGTEDADWVRLRAFEAWRGRDPRRFGVMARHGFNAGWDAALKNMKENTDG